mmetsp:Transcript_4145/g.5834  ORF Transcript_4145/g.5834 Transcript_4145/m.5834 type:complete len:125 (+) Transcript_4145:1-375(+)
MVAAVMCAVSGPGRARAKRTAFLVPQGRKYAWLPFAALEVSTLKSANAESIQVGNTYYNMDAVGAAAGVDPSRLVEQTPSNQVVQAVQDITTELLIPSLVGFSLVYGIALTLGLVEGPFDSGKK